MLSFKIFFLLFAWVITTHQTISKSLSQDLKKNNFIGLISKTKQVTYTQKLLRLYKQKFELLQSIYKTIDNQEITQKNSSLQQAGFSQIKIYNVQDHGQELNLIKNNEQKYVLSQVFNDKVSYMYPYYFIKKNIIFYTFLQSRQTQASLVGKVLFQDRNKIYTTFGTKIGQSKIESVYPQNISIKSQITGYSAAEVDSSSIWHYLLNSYQMSDLLISFKQTIIYLRQKKSLVEVDCHSKVLKVYSINQYKIFFLAQKSLGIINVISGEITSEIKFDQQKNNLNQSQPELYFEQKVLAKSCAKTEQFIYILLNNYTILSYSNEKIMNYQKLQKLEEYVNLSFSGEVDHIESQYEKEINIYYIYPYLFVTNSYNPSFLVYNISNYNFYYWTHIQLDLQAVEQQKDNHKESKKNKTFYQYQFYKLNKTIQVLISSLTQKLLYTYRFRLLLDYIPFIPTIANSYTWNIVLIILAVGLVILIKYRNKNKFKEIEYPNDKFKQQGRKSKKKIENQEIRLLQAYLQKEGQKLTKQQIEQLIFEIQQQRQQKASEKTKEEDFEKKRKEGYEKNKEQVQKLLVKKNKSQVSELQKQKNRANKKQK